MKRSLIWGTVIALSITLSACTNNRQTGDSSLPTTEPTTIEVSPDPPETADETTASAHSPLYLPEYTAEQIMIYFEEIVLHMEYPDGTGNPALVQKWIEPIRYRVTGKPTEEDMTVLTDCITQLNTIESFPGIYPAAEGEFENVTLHFLDPDEFRLRFSEIVQGEDAFGATQFWYYTETNDIYTANIGYRTDLDQAVRSSIIIEEIVNMLGVSDSELREDSIVYQHSNENLALSDVDWVILKLLYDPAVQCGMNSDQCNAIIDQLYY